MKITKLGHSCLLVEMPDPVNRTVLFDPGEWSREFVDVESLVYLDDIVITHGHADHCSVPLLRQLLEKFPDVRITAPDEVVASLKQSEILASHEEYEGIAFFDSPHAPLEPLGATPEQIGVHYLDTLTHPGDSHTFRETRQILAMPMSAPWGAMTRAVEVILELKPTYVVPIHDWLWKDAAREAMYPGVKKLLAEQDITFLDLTIGEPVVVAV